MDSKRVAITLGVMCALLTSGIIIQVNTIKNNSIEGTSSIRTANSELKDEVLKWKEKYEKSYLELQSAEEELDDMRKKATKDNTQSTEVEKELKKMNMLLGLTEVKGEGAISINGQRIVSTSYINCVGSVINVNGEKVNSPFVISAIGNSASLSGIERPGSYIQYMKEDGITVKIEKLSVVTIPKYKKVLNSKYMKNIK